MSESQGEGLAGEICTKVTLDIHTDFCFVLNLAIQRKLAFFSLTLSLLIGMRQLQQTVERLAVRVSVASADIETEKCSLLQVCRITNVLWYSSFTCLFAVSNVFSTFYGTL
jgi:heme/copper-type cytochrome/quinol oxidase subunit 3